MSPYLQSGGDTYWGLRTTFGNYGFVDIGDGFGYYVWGSYSDTYGYNSYGAGGSNTCLPVPNTLYEAWSAVSTLPPPPPPPPPPEGGGGG
jgi:hypothetical protein